MSFFYQVPLRLAEQRYFAFWHKASIHVYTRIAQGSLDGPSLYGRLSAFVGRSLVSPAEARLQIYIDDPILTILVITERANLLICIVTMAWLIMGFDMAFHKAQKGPKVSWVGYEIEDTPASTFVKVKTEFTDELWKYTKGVMRKNVIGLKFLRSFTGRINHAANLMWVRRPFLDVLWAATASEPALEDITHKTKRQGHKSRAPNGGIWAKQLKQSLSWIWAFLNK